MHLRASQVQGLWEGRSTELLKLLLLRDLYVPFPSSCTCGCCRQFQRDMGLAFLPMALLVLPALLLWPTMAHDSEEPNVRCGGECWCVRWGVGGAGCLSPGLLEVTPVPALWEADHCTISFPRHFCALGTQQKPSGVPAVRLLAQS